MLEEQHHETAHLHIKKQQTDLMAGLFYAMGISLVHLAFIVAWFTMRLPNVEKGKEMDKVFEATNAL